MSLLGLAFRLSPLLLVIGVVPAGPAGGAETGLAAPGRQRGELERVQMHGSRLRGIAYRPTRVADGSPEPETFTLAPVTTIQLDGDPQLNVRGNLYPIDADGDGRFEFLHFNGYRLMRVYAADGRKLWQVDNPGGRVHRSNAHRDTLAVFDTDGDGRQDIAHCWRDPGEDGKLLVLREGATGRVLKKVQIEGQGGGEECHIAAFRFAGKEEPYILVAGKAPGGACGKMNWTDTWSGTIAYRSDLTKLWERTTCTAGHYAWPLDADGDGEAERVFVGKYLLWPTGAVSCVLPGFGTDHVDSMVVADLNRSQSGLEVLTVGASGTRFYSASNCNLLWGVGNSAIGNPQKAGAAHLDPDEPTPSMLVTTKTNRDEIGPADLPLRAYALDPDGRIVGSYTEEAGTHAAPITNANLDGAPAAEDRVVSFGQVVDGRGRRRLDVSWYWDLQRLTPEEERLEVRDQWASSSLVFDLDDDGRDELIVWGRQKIVVGTRGGGASDKEARRPAAATGSGAASSTARDRR